MLNIPVAFGILKKINKKNLDFFPIWKISKLKSGTEIPRGTKLWQGWSKMWVETSREWDSGMVETWMEQISQVWKGRKSSERLNPVARSPLRKAEWQARGERGKEVRGVSCGRFRGGGDLDLTDNRQATSIAEQCSASLCQCVWAIRKKRRWYMCWASGRY